MWRLLLFALLISAEDLSDVDGETSRKILGSSVVTSVSVIMDTGNGSKVYSDAVGKPVAKPIAATDLASPINLLNPDRYEFYTFDDSGDLVKRLMTLEEIQEIIATGDGDGLSLDTFTSNGFIPEKRFNDVVTNVQNVLKEEMEVHQDLKNPQYDTPDVSDSWSMILPSIFGNSGEDIKLEKPVAHGTPDTIMIEPTIPPPTSSASPPSSMIEPTIPPSNAPPTSSASPPSSLQPIVSSTTEQISSSHKIMTLATKKTTSTTTTSTTEPPPNIIVDITTNSNSTTERGDISGVENSHIVEIKPVVVNELELTKENSRPIFRVPTRKPAVVTTTKSHPSKPMKITIASTTKPDTTSTIQQPITTVESIISQTSTLGTTTTVKVQATTPTTVKFITTPTSTVGTTKLVKKEATTPTSTTTTTKFTTTPTSVPSTVKFVTTESVMASTTKPDTTSSSVLTTTVVPSTQTYMPTTTDSVTQTANQFSTKAESSTQFTTEQNSETTIQPMYRPFTVTENASGEASTITSTQRYRPTRSTTIQTSTVAHTTSNVKAPLETSTQSVFTTTEKIKSTILNDAVDSSTTPMAFSTATESEVIFSTKLPEVILSTKLPVVKKPALPTLLEILNQNSFSTTTNEPQETTTNLPSTFGGLSTFFVVADNKVRPNSTSSTINNITVVDEDSTTEDLSTLSTEYVALKTITPSKVPNSTLSTTTEQSQATDRTTILDQFLLTSTNIYEINSELSNKGYQTTVFEDSAESTTNNDQPTETLLIKVTTEPPATTTTDRNFIESIEQLISQAVGTAEPPVEASNMAETVHEMMMDSGHQAMPQVQQVTATIASNLIDNVDRVSTTTIDNSLSDSIGSLLSQVSDEASTTVDYVESTTTDSSTTQRSTTEVSTEKPDDFVPHIINITIIRNENRTKPYKADLRLEANADEFVMKNFTRIPTSDAVEVLKPEATSSIHEGLDETTDVSTESESTPITLGNATEFVTKRSSDPDVTTLNDIIETTASTSTTTTAASTTTTTAATTTTPKSDPQPSIVISIKENLNQTETDESTTWTLVSTVDPHEVKVDTTTESGTHPISTIIEPTAAVDLVHKPLQGFGLEDSTVHLDPDVYQFVQLCNELAFSFWKSVTTGISSARSVIVSPFAATSLLAMVFLGARGSTSGEMNEILKLDDMVTFNPHMIFKNVSESIETGGKSGVTTSVMIRQLYSDRSKGKLLGFYKERVRQFYDGHVEEASFREIGDVIRRRTNLLVKKYTGGKTSEFLRDSHIHAKAPLAGISVSIFQTDCSEASTEHRDGELYFVALPTIRQRRLVPVPAAVWRSGFLAGYEPSLDATAAALGSKDQVISTIFVIPGQQGIAAPGDGLARLEKHLVESSFKQGAWSRLLRSLIPRPGLELQIPRFVHRSIINATISLKNMGLKDLFDPHKADLRGLNGAAHELHLSDILQINEFATCGDNKIGESHHREVYPATTDRRSRMLEYWDEPRDYQRAFHDPLHDPSYLDLPLPLRPRQARLPEAPRLRFDRPFLYFVRHNPSGLILHMGRFHPRLLP